MRLQKGQALQKESMVLTVPQVLIATLGTRRTNYGHNMSSPVQKPCFSWFPTSPPCLESAIPSPKQGRHALAGPLFSLYFALSTMP